MKLRNVGFCLLLVLAMGCAPADEGGGPDGDSNTTLRPPVVPVDSASWENSPNA